MVMMNIISDLGWEDIIINIFNVIIIIIIIIIIISFTIVNQISIKNYLVNKPFRQLVHIYCRIMPEAERLLEK